MEDAVRALQQQVNAAQLLSQQNIAQGLADLPGAITTVLNRAQAPTRRILFAWESHQCSRAEKKLLGKVEKHVSGVFPNVRGALTFAVESQDGHGDTEQIHDKQLAFLFIFFFDFLEVLHFRAGQR